MQGCLANVTNSYEWAYKRYECTYECPTNVAKCFVIFLRYELFDDAAAIGVNMRSESASYFLGTSLRGAIFVSILARHLQFS